MQKCSWPLVEQGVCHGEFSEKATIEGFPTPGPGHFGYENMPKTNLLI